VNHRQAKTWRLCFIARASPQRSRAASRTCAPWCGEIACAYVRSAQVPGRGLQRLAV